MDIIANASGPYGPSGQIVMQVPRAFIDQELATGKSIQLPAEAARHLGTVLRLKAGQELEVFNGAGGCYRARLLSADRRGAIVELLEFQNDDRESPLSLVLVQGISRGQHMDYTLQKSVELGVTAIVPLLSEHSNVRLDDDRSKSRMAHWRGVMISACEQCGRNRIPDLVQPRAPADWLAEDSSDQRFLLDPGGEKLAEGSGRPRSVSLMVGPEGGFSTREIQLALDRGYRRTHLGPRTLRTETAAVAAIALCQALWGDLREGVQ